MCLRRSIERGNLVNPAQTIHQNSKIRAQIPLTWHDMELPTHILAPPTHRRCGGAYVCARGTKHDYLQFPATGISRFFSSSQVSVLSCLWSEQ